MEIYIKTLGILNIFLIFLIFLFIFYIRLSNFLKNLNNNIEICRKFIIKNDSFFSILFIVLFGLEQVALIIFVFVYNEHINILKLIISIFALVVITTASLQKSLLDTKRKHEKEQYESAVEAKKYIKKIVDGERN